MHAPIIFFQKFPDLEFHACWILALLVPKQCKVLMLWYLISKFHLQYLEKVIMCSDVFLSLLSLYHCLNQPILVCKFMHQSIICLLNCRLSSQFFLYLDCKMRWFPQSTCRFCMLKQLLITGNPSLWSFLMACIWTLGRLVVIITGERFSSSLNNIFQRKKRMTHPAIKMVSFFC